MIRILVALVLLAGPVHAQWHRPGPMTNWVDLVEGLRERAEVTRYDTNAWEVAPPVFVQPINIGLGTMIHQLGPVICETNISAGVTNVWCWTNWVALSSDYVAYSNGGPFDGQAYLPYGPQFATNLVWTNSDPRLASITSTPSAVTSLPSRKVIAQLDEATLTLLPYYVDTVAVSNAGGLDAWFATATGTNWTWVDYNYSTNGGETWITNDLWISWPAYPQTLPMLTPSNAWRNAGLEPYRYPSSIVTNAEPVYGWQVGQLDTYSVATNLVVTTNWTERYTFTLAPTLTPWRVSLGQLRAEVTSITTNAGITNYAEVTKQIGWRFVPRDATPTDTLVPRLLGLEYTPTNRMVLVPPGTSTGTAWQALYAGLVVDVSGYAIITTGGLWQINEPASNTLSGSAFTWSSNAAAVVVSNLYRVATLSSTSVLADVYSNGVLQATIEVAGTTVDFILEGVSYEKIAPYDEQGTPQQGAGWWMPTANDVAERAAIVRQMQWTAKVRDENFGGEDRQDAGLIWSNAITWSGWDNVSVAPTQDGEWVPPAHNAEEHRGLPVFTFDGGYEWYVYDDEGWSETYYQPRAGYTNNGPTNYSGTVRIEWADTYRVDLAGLTTQRASTVRYYALAKRLMPAETWEAAGALGPDPIITDGQQYGGPIQRAVVSRDMSYWVGTEMCYPVQTTTNFSSTWSQTSDHIGSAEYWPTERAVMSKSAGADSVALVGIDMASGARPLSEWADVWSIDATRELTYGPCGTDQESGYFLNRFRYKATRIQPVQRSVQAENYLFQWDFQYLR